MLKKLKKRADQVLARVFKTFVGSTTNKFGLRVARTIPGFKNES